jgi:hypothetical protein
MACSTLTHALMNDRGASASVVRQKLLSALHLLIGEAEGSSTTLVGVHECGWSRTNHAVRCEWVLLGDAARLASTYEHRASTVALLEMAVDMLVRRLTLAASILCGLLCQALLGVHTHPTTPSLR